MKTPKITKAQQIKDIIKPIPADMFITHSFANMNTPEDGKSCFLGHIHRKANKSDKLLGFIPINDKNDFLGDRNGFGARQLTAKFLMDKHGLINEDGASVNNNPTINGYTEPQIKDRLMHLLDDMIKAGY